MNPTPPNTSRTGRQRLLAIGLGLIVLVCGGLVISRSRPAVPESPVTVLGPRANCIRFSPDRNSKYVAAAFSDGRVRLWDSATKQEIPVKFPSKWPLNDIAWTSDGSLLFVGGFEQHVLFWNVKSKQARKLPMFSAPVVSIAVRPNQMEILTSLANGELWWTDLESDNGELIPSGHRGIVKVVRYHPDAQSFVTGGADGQLAWHSAETRTVTSKIAAHQHEISSLAFSTDGKRLATSSWDNTTQIWQLGDTEPRATLTHPDGVANVAWQGDDIVTSCWDRRIRLWNVTTSQVTKQRECRSESLSFAIWPGHPEIVEIDSAERLSFNPP